GRCAAPLRGHVTGAAAARLRTPHSAGRRTPAAAGVVSRTRNVTGRIAAERSGSELGRQGGDLVTVNTMIPVARPWMGEEEAGAARRAILSGWVTQGPEVAAFEHEFGAAVGAPFACAV